MLSFNGVNVCTGMSVIILQTPVVRQHEFLNGKVVGLTDKMVRVEAFSTGDRHGYDKGLKVFNRKPDQVIADSISDQGIYRDCY